MGGGGKEWSQWVVFNPSDGFALVNVPKEFWAPLVLVQTNVTSLQIVDLLWFMLMKELVLYV